MSELYQHADRRVLAVERDVLIEYLRAKLVAEDWHGVADAAMDLREIDAKLAVLPKKETPC